MTEDRMNPTGDDRISAWIDGNLDRGGATEMEKLARLDGVVAMRAARLRHLDDVLRQAVPLDEELPDDLLARLGLADQEPACEGAEVVDLAAARAARQGDGMPGLAARKMPVLAGGWRIAAQLVLALGVGLAGTVWLRSADGEKEANRKTNQVSAPYVALGDAPKSGEAVSSANAIVMFTADTDASEARSIVADAGALVVSGPTSSGVWQLAIASEDRDAVLVRLRQRGDVSLAEPIDGVEP